MTKRTMKKKAKTLRKQLEALYSPAVTNNNHSVSIRWDVKQKVYNVTIVGRLAHYKDCTHTKEFSVGLFDKPHTMGQLFYGSRWM